ncbi:MAG: hypothetical protein HC781_22725 [Leptolyngbyaceae cyanobacterium CSU_1_4]|nr:hypothetical protein [Leptolyngbyaceae cyanobacterium CSU_1_4]
MPRIRSYNPDRILSPLPPPVVEVGDGRLVPWEDGALLHDVKAAAEILTQKLGGGYSEQMIRRRINGGIWIKNQHWYKTGSLYKVSIARVIEWQAKGG